MKSQAFNWIGIQILTMICKVGYTRQIRHLGSLAKRALALTLPNPKDVALARSLKIKNIRTCARALDSIKNFCFFTISFIHCQNSAELSVIVKLVQ
jgi:hypothetical protein